MATLEIRKAIIPSDKYILTLSKEEAEALVAVLVNIGGEPTRSPRGYTQSVLSALKCKGVCGIGVLYPVGGSLWFKDTQ
jgi:hypothetical protein